MKKWRRLQRAFAIALTAACILTSSGFTVLAAEVSSNNAVSSNSISSNTTETNSNTDESTAADAGGNSTKQTVTSTVVFQTGSGEAVSTGEISVELTEGENYAITEADVKGVLPADYTLKSVDLSSATVTVGNPVTVTAIVEAVEKNIPEEGTSVKSTATAKVTFQTEDGVEVEDSAKDVTVEFEGEEYTFTSADIDDIDILPAGYELIEIDPAEVVAAAGEEVEIVATVKEREFSIMAVSPRATVTGVEAITGVTLDTSKIAIFPDEAKWFFDADGEVASFGTADIDVYRDDLPTNRANRLVNNTLVLKSSTDGGIYNLQNKIYPQNDGTYPKNPGVFSINWESGYYQDWSNTKPVDKDTKYDSVEEVPGTGKLFGNGYTDGTYTIVGWGGDYQAGKAKNHLRIRVRDNGDGTLSDALSHLTIYLVGPHGAIYDKIWVQSSDGRGLNGAGVTEDDLYLVYKNGVPYVDEDGNYVFEAKLRGSQYVQGIKFAFDHTSAQEGSDTSLRHSGTLLIAQVEIECADVNYQDFSPIKYTGDMSDNTYLEDMLDSAYLPFIRSKTNNSGTADGSKSGANLSKQYGWHYWTMSTSDANIVHNNTSAIDALQIKYRSDVYTPTSKDSTYKAHETYAMLDGVKDLNAHWLVMTLGTAQLDNSILDMKVQLIDNTGATTEVPLRSFVKSMENGAEKITADYIAEQYRTVYFDLTSLEGFNGFRSIRFLYDSIADGKATTTRDSRYFYLTQVYLIGESATIYKTVDKTSVYPGVELTYTIKVTNNGTVDLTQYTVKDELPENTTFVSCTGSAQYAEGVLTIEGADLEIGETATYTVKVKVSDQATNGTLLNNQAGLTKINNEAVDIKSEIAQTVVISNTYVFYAEVGQTTNLPVNPTLTILPATATMKTYNAARNENGEFTKTTSWGTMNSKTFTADNGEMFEFVEGWNIITFQALGSPDDRDIGLGSVTLYNEKGEIITTVSGSTYKANKVDNSLKEPTGEGPSYFYIPVGKDAEGDGVDWNGTVLGDVGKNTVYILVYLTAEEIAKGSTGKIGFSYCTARVDESATFSCAPVASTTVEPVTLDATIGDVNGLDVKPRTISKSASEKELNYKSEVTGKDTFDIPVIAEGTDYKTATVVVYNYQVQNHVYVLDYGLKADLTADDTNNTNGLLNDATLSIDGDDASAAFVGLANTKRNTNGVADSTGDYSQPYGDAGEGQTLSKTNGTASYSGAIDSDLKVVYEPTKFMDSVDTFYYGVQVGKNNATDLTTSKTATPVMEGEIKVMPASIVYYEDNFSKSGADADGTDGIKFIVSGELSTDGTAGADRYQSNDLNEQYGHDSSYAGDDKYSNGTTTQMASGNKAVFKFKGTGFDIISRTNDATGSLVVNVFKADEGQASIDSDGKVVNTSGQLVTSMIVNTFYENGDLYQIPVISKKDLDYGTYIIQMTAVNKTGQTVYIDGIRIYNPAGAGEDKNSEITDEYAKENPGEVDASVKGLKDLILGEGYQFNDSDPASSVAGNDPVVSLIRYDKDSDTVQALTGMTVTENYSGYYFGAAAKVTDTNLTADLLTYAVQGPNNEVYLSDGYGISFTVSPTENATSFILQVGAKAISGTPTIELLSGTDESPEWIPLVAVETESLSTATEMYYPIDITKSFDYADGYATIHLRVTGAEGAVVSLTNLKLKGYDLQAIELPELSDTNINLNPSAFNVSAGGSVTKGVKGNVTLKITEGTEAASKVIVYDQDENEVQLLTSSKSGSKWTVRFKVTAGAYQRYIFVLVGEDGSISETQVLGTSLSN